MKVLVVLVLAVFAGCNASVFQADAPKSPSEELQDAFWRFVGDATNTAENTVQAIRSSQLGQDITAQLTAKTELATQYVGQLQQQLSPEQQEMVKNAQAEVQQAFQGFMMANQPFFEEMKKQAKQTEATIRQKFEQFKQEMQAFADSRGLTSTLSSRFEDLQAVLGKSVSELQSHLEPLSEEARNKFQQHAEDLKVSIAPMIQQMQAEVTKKFIEGKEMAAPYINEMREALNPATDNLQERLSALVQTFVSNIQA